MMETWKKNLRKAVLLFACLMTVVMIRPIQAHAATEISMVVGQTKRLGAFSGQTGVFWKSLNAPVATVTQTGIIRGVSEGQATIVASLNGRTARALVTVTNPLKLSSSAFSIRAGKTQYLTAKYNGAAVKPTWKSLNAGVATINSSTGVVTAIKAGKAAMIATYNGLSARCLVTVYGVPETTVTISPSSVSMSAGTTRTLSAAVSGGTGSVEWKSLNAPVATVSSRGVVTARSAGTATITATVNGVVARCSVTVTGTVGTIRLDYPAVTLAVGKTKKLTASVTGSSRVVTWKSLNAPVATVSSTGLITARKAGIATITATANGVTARCSVTVYDAAELYSRAISGINYADGVLAALYDIDRDGIKELFVYKWAEGRTQWEQFFTIRNGAVVNLGSFRQTSNLLQDDIPISGLSLYGVPSSKGIIVRFVVYIGCFNLTGNRLKLIDEAVTEEEYEARLRSIYSRYESNISNNKIVLSHIESQSEMISFLRNNF